MSDDALFPVEPVHPSFAERLSADRRRTLRQAEDITRGQHPLARVLPGSDNHGHLPLHPDAAPADDRRAPGPRCGNCRFRRTRHHHDQAYAKCIYPGTWGADQYELHGPPRVTGGPASDVRSWWPGCRDWEPGDQQLPDAMRWVPDPAVIR